VYTLADGEVAAVFGRMMTLLHRVSLKQSIGPFPYSTSSKSCKTVAITRAAASGSVFRNSRHARHSTIWIHMFWFCSSKILQSDARTCSLLLSSRARFGGPWICPPPPLASDRRAHVDVCFRSDLNSFLHSYESEQRTNR